MILNNEERGKDKGKWVWLGKLGVARKMRGARGKGRENRGEIIVMYNMYTERYLKVTFSYIG